MANSNVNTPVVDQTLPPSEYSNLLTNVFTNNDNTYEQAILPINISIQNETKNYYTIDDYNKLSSPAQLSIISLNINSLKKHMDDLFGFLKSMTKTPNVIILSEIRHNVDEILNMYFPDYNYYISYPKTNKCGGVCILINKCIPHTYDKNLQIDHNLIENVVVKLNCTHTSLYVSGIYKHPALSNLKELGELLINQLSKIPKNATTILAGDFNVNLMNETNDANIMNYINKLESNNIKQVISGATRISNTSRSLIDHMYLSNNKSLRIHRGIFVNQISDHLCLFMNINLKPLPSNHRPKIRIINQRNIEIFKNLLSNLENSINPSGNFNNADERWDYFTDSIMKSFNKAFPMQILSKKKNKNKNWLTKGLLKCIKNKEKLYLKWKNNSSNLNERVYKSYKNRLSSLIRNAKSHYYANLFETDPHNKKMWNEINKILGKNSMKEEIEVLNFENKNISSAGDIANSLNNFFSSIGEKMSSNINYNMSDFKNYMPTSLNNSILLAKIGNEEVEKIIDSLSNKKSSGIDMISQYLVKKTKTILSPILTKLINYSISENSYPSCLKIAKITPIYKNGDKTDCNNFRPISILSTFNKIFERKIHNDISVFIEKNQILYTNQFGFRKFHSTIDALMKSHDYIISERRKNNKIIGIFIDLKKAFDSLDNSILIKKLEYYGIRGPYNKLIESYLTNRKCITHVRDVVSSTRQIKFGVPQGSILGPLLFTLYINDIKNLARDDEINLFADDTSIFCSSKNYRLLKTKCNNILHKCKEWLSCNALTLNIQKTHFIDFSKKQTRDEPLVLEINGEKLSEATETKYLGMIIQNNLRWDKHIQMIIKKINSKLPVFYQLRNILQKDKKITAFNSLILSNIIYGIELYGKNSNIWTNLLQKAQNRILKVLLKLNRYTNTNSLHIAHGLLKVADLCKLRTALIGHKVIYYQNTTNTAHVGIERINRHERPLRNNLNLNITTESYLRYNKVSENVCVSWNSLPYELKKITTRSKFKESLKEYFLKTYI